MRVNHFSEKNNCYRFCNEVLLVFLRGDVSGQSAGYLESSGGPRNLLFFATAESVIIRRYCFVSVDPAVSLSLRHLLL